MTTTPYTEEQAAELARKPGLWLDDRGVTQGLDADELAAIINAALSQQAACPVCSGNDGDAPCAYTTEKPDGCLRAARLEQQAAPVAGEIVDTDLKEGGFHTLADMLTTKIAAILPEPRTDELVAMAYRKAAECLRKTRVSHDSEGYVKAAINSFEIALESLTPPDAQAALEELLVDAVKRGMAVEEANQTAGTGTMDADAREIVATLNQQKD
jgi:hypothetical protein